MKVKFILFNDGISNIQEIFQLLERAESILIFEFAQKDIKKFGEDKIKSEILWPLSVSKRIGIHQTRRTKSLYPQLVIFLDNKPFTFYPQRYGKKEITIERFLEDLIKGKISCLHDAVELKTCLKSK